MSEREGVLISTIWILRKSQQCSSPQEKAALRNWILVQLKKKSRCLGASTSWQKCDTKASWSMTSVFRCHWDKLYQHHLAYLGLVVLAGERYSILIPIVYHFHRHWVLLPWSGTYLHFGSVCVHVCVCVCVCVGARVRVRCVVYTTLCQFICVTYSLCQKMSVLCQFVFCAGMRWLVFAVTQISVTAAVHARAAFHVHVILFYFYFFCWFSLKRWTCSGDS